MDNFVDAVASRDIVVWIALIIKGSALHSGMNPWKTVQREVIKTRKGKESMAYEDRSQERAVYGLPKGI